jgi:putative hydrolase of the HAD superfamily
MGAMVDVVGFDGDDTLWHNESIFSVTQERFRDLMAPYLDGADIDERLHDTELRNLELYGYGVKSFTLSMIETAVEVSSGRVSSGEITAILDAGKQMLAHPVELLEGVEEAIDVVGRHHRMILITKCDLFNQESKLARSGLAERFSAIEIVSEKHEDTYRKILDRHAIDPERFLMVGNSLRSDISPVLDLGGWAVHVPYHLLWRHELIDDEASVRGHRRFRHLDSLAGLPELLARIRDGEDGG